MTEEGKDVSFTTASGKSVSFKSKGKPRAKKEVVATPVETEPPEAPVRIKKPRAPKEPAVEDVPAPDKPVAPVVEEPAPPAPEPPAPETAAPPPTPEAPAPTEAAAPPEPTPIAPEPAKPRAKRKPRAQPGIGKLPPKQGLDPPPEPPPLERQDAAFPLMSPEDFGMLFGNYLQTQQASKRATKHELYRSWVGI